MLSKKNWIYYFLILMICEVVLACMNFFHHSILFLIGLEIVESLLFYFLIKNKYQNMLKKCFFIIFIISIVFVNLIVILLFLFQRFEVINNTHILLLIYAVILFFVNFFFAKFNKDEQIDIFIQLLILLVSIVLSIIIGYIRFSVIKPQLTFTFLLFDILTFADFIELGFVIDFTVLFELLYFAINMRTNKHKKRKKSIPPNCDLQE